MQISITSYVCLGYDKILLKYKLNYSHMTKNTHTITERIKYIYGHHYYLGYPFDCV